MYMAFGWNYSTRHEIPFCEAGPKFKSGKLLVTRNRHAAIPAVGPYCLACVVRHAGSFSR